MVKARHTNEKAGGIVGSTTGIGSGKAYLCGRHQCDCVNAGVECGLTSGDVVTRLTDTPDVDNMVNATVSTSRKGDCAAGATVAVKVDDAGSRRESGCTACTSASRLSTHIVCSKGWSKPVWYFSATINGRGIVKCIRNVLGATRANDGCGTRTE